MSHRLNKTRRGDYLLLGPYDERLVSWLKDHVPASGRQWMPVLKAWRIRAEYAAEVAAHIGQEVLA